MKLFRKMKSMKLMFYSTLNELMYVLYNEIELITRVPTSTYFWSQYYWVIITASKLYIYHNFLITYHNFIFFMINSYMLNILQITKAIHENETMCVNCKTTYVIIKGTNEININQSRINENATFNSEIDILKLVY